MDDVEAADVARHSVAVQAGVYSKTLVAFARHDRIPDAREALADMGIIVAPLTRTFH